MSYNRLLVAHDVVVGTTRAMILLKAGYSVTPTPDADSALSLLNKRSFDIILVGRDSLPPLRPADEQIRRRHPDALILKIVSAPNIDVSHASDTTESTPARMLAPIKSILASAKTANRLSS